MGAKTSPLGSPRRSPQRIMRNVVRDVCLVAAQDRYETSFAHSMFDSGFPGPRKRLRQLADA